MVGIEIADISIRFPEIMKEEYKDLIKYLNESHIVFKIESDKSIDRSTFERLREEKKRLHLYMIENYGLSHSEVKSIENGDKTS